MTTYNEQKFNLPYRQSYGFNAFDNMTERNNLHWGVEEWASQTFNLEYTYTNNRVADWVYDFEKLTGSNLRYCDILTLGESQKRRFDPMLS